MPLKQVALWYPRIPEPELHLNEFSFTGQDPRYTGYQPLFWIHFGGLGGADLSHIVGVSYQYMHNLRSLSFHYDGLHGAGHSEKLGRCKDSELPQSPIFSIDGINGERVVFIDVYMQKNWNPTAYDFLNHGVLRSIKVDIFYEQLPELCRLSHCGA